MATRTVPSRVPWAVVERLNITLDDEQAEKLALL